jgi:hypothetical protein
MERDYRNLFRVSLANVPSLDRRSLPVVLRAFSDGGERVTESGKAAFLQTAIFLMFLAHFAVANACKTSQAKSVLVYLF